MSEFGTSSSRPLSPEQLAQKKQQCRTNYYIRLPQSYAQFFQAMAEDYYRRGKIEKPSIGLLAKNCLITAGNAWNRMQVQQMTKEYQRKMQEQEQDPQNYQQRQQFVQSDNLAPQSIASNRRPPPFVEGKTKRQLQPEATNQVNTSVTEWGYPTFVPRSDSINVPPKRTQQNQSRPRFKDEFFYDEDYGALM